MQGGSSADHHYKLTSSPPLGVLRDPLSQVSFEIHDFGEAKVDEYHKTHTAAG
jgi:hypothetical protein